MYPEKHITLLEEAEEGVTVVKIKNQTLEHNINEHQKLIEYNIQLRKHRTIITQLIDNCLQSITKTKATEENTKELEKHFNHLTKLINSNYKLTKTIIGTTIRINELNELIIELNKELHPEDNKQGLNSLAESIRNSLKMLNNTEEIN